MDNRFRIVLEDKLLPVQAFFNAIPDRRFISTLEAFSRGVGAGFNETYCGFPGDEEIGDEPLSGIEFAIKDEEIILPYTDFFDILSRVCDSYIAHNPERKNEVTSLLSLIKNKLNALDKS